MFQGTKLLVTDIDIPQRLKYLQGKWFSIYYFHWYSYISDWFMSSNYLYLPKVFIPIELLTVYEIPGTNYIVSSFFLYDRQWYVHNCADWKKWETIHVFWNVKTEKVWQLLVFCPHKSVICQTTFRCNYSSRFIGKCFCPVCRSKDRHFTR